MSGRIALRDALGDHAKRVVDRHQAIRRANVVDTSPLTVDVFGYGIPLTLDDDFELSQWMAFYQSAVGLQVDDLVLMHQEDQDWTLVDVVSDTAIPPKITGKAPPPTWTPLPYATGAGTGGWGDSGGGLEPGGFLLDGNGFCHVRATCKNANAVGYPSTNVLIATVPYHPRYAKQFIGAALDTASHYISLLLVVQTSGQITLAGADVGQVPLGNNGNYQWLSFSTDFQVT